MYQWLWDACQDVAQVCRDNCHLLWLCRISPKLFIYSTCESTDKLGVFIELLAKVLMFEQLLERQL